MPAKNDWQDPATRNAFCTDYASAKTMSEIRAKWNLTSASVYATAKRFRAVRYASVAPKAIAPELVQMAAAAAAVGEPAPGSIPLDTPRKRSGFKDRAAEAVAELRKTDRIVRLRDQEAGKVQVSAPDTFRGHGTNTLWVRERNVESFLLRTPGAFIVSPTA